MDIRPHETKHSRMEQDSFVEDSLLKNLLGQFLNTLLHIQFNPLTSGLITYNYYCISDNNIN